MATNLKVQGNHIQYILSEIFGFDMSGGYTGHPMKKDEYNIYNLANGAITTEDDDRIKVHYFWDYRITVKNNLFTFAIVDKTINHVMKILTDEEQTKILVYLGFQPKQKISAENELKIRQMVKEFYEQNQGKEISIVEFTPEMDMNEPDSEGSTTSEDVDCICAGCNHEIDEDGFCSEGCRYGEIAGFWTCKKCSNKCENVEVCPNCDDDNDCICVTDEDENVIANKNCNQHNCCKVCSKCVECKFNDVAWLCADCQKNIDDESEDEDDILCCERCGYEDHKNEDGEWTEVLTHSESDKVFCKDCMPEDESDDESDDE